MQITVSAQIHKDIADIWQLWTSPAHIVNWNFAHESWCCPVATNDLQVGGKFSYRMEARDKSFGFDLAGEYKEVVLNSKIVYSLGDMRIVTVLFTQENDVTTITEVFDAETSHSVQQQQDGWQAILNNFISYAEKN